ncbi:MAG: PP2C family protein-serine/threonine phosphatase [Candidatus Binatia bacterium]
MNNRTPGDAVARLHLLHELGCAFAARLDLGELTALVLAKCREVLCAEAAAVLLLDADRRELFFPYIADADADVGQRVAAIRFPAGQGIAGEVLRTGNPLRIDDAAGDPRFYRGVDQRSGLVTRNLICAPLRSRQGAIGVIQVLNRRNDAPFDDDDLGFLDALGGSVAVAIENARFYAQLQEQVAALERAVQEHNELIAIRRELDVARNIQASILPRTFPPFPERADVDIFAAMVPAHEVGGDFYDFFFLDPHRLGFAIADVSGKGVPAALFMAMSRTVLKAVALEGGSPGECLERVNRLLCSDNDAEMFVSLFYGILDSRSGAITYANGGHNPPFVLRADGSAEALPSAGGTVLGVLDGARYQTAALRLRPAEGVVLYTDGVTEAMDGADRLFSAERLHALLQGANGMSAETAIRAVFEAVDRHAAGAPQSDDITALAIRYLG